MSDFQDQLRTFSTAIEHELESRAIAFPTVLELSLRIRTVANDPDSSVGQIAELIRIEPVVSARVIQMANSVVFNPGGNRVSGVPAAIARIGLSNVRTIAVVVAMGQLAEERRSQAMRERARVVWQHAVDTGAWAYAFASQRRRDLADGALLAGLLTQIGPLYLVARVVGYPAVAADPGGFAEIAEFWSAEVTHSILEKLELPAEIVEAVDAAAWEPDASAWPPASLADGVALARLLAQPEIAFDARDRATRSARLDRLRARAASPTLDELLATVAPRRDEILAVLRP